MQILTIASDNKNSLKAIKAFAKEQSDVTITVKKEQETDEFFYINGVRVRKGKGKLNVDKMAGSLSHINFEDPKIIREKAWRRKKAEF
jgi:hypothetical protein